jgi:peptide chain release factor subunit 1
MTANWVSAQGSPSMAKGVESPLKGRGCFRSLSCRGSWVQIPPPAPINKNLVMYMVAGSTHFYSCQVASTNSVKLHKLRKQIAYLSEKESKAKDFVSLYIPAQSDVEQIIAALKKQPDCAVFESERAKERLQDAVKSITQRVREHKEISENGLALFAGTYVDDGAEREVLSVKELIPPEPTIAYLFAMDDHFRLEPLREMLRDQKIVGILALDAKEASFGLLKGERVELVKSISSGVPGKTGKGGQSQRRYERERDMELAYFFHRVAEHATEAFLTNHVNVLIAGGPGQTKKDFLKGEYLHYELNNMLLNIVDTQSAGKEALKEVFDKSSELLNNMCGPEERKIIQRLLSELAKPNGLATYGLEAVLGALNKGAVQVAVVADNTDVVESIAVCKKCGHTIKRLAKAESQVTNEIAKAPCEKCGAVTYEIHQKDIVDVLEDMASKTNSAVEVISTPSKEKDQLNALSGVAALLRYKTG